MTSNVRRFESVFSAVYIFMWSACFGVSTSFVAFTLSWQSSIDVLYFIFLAIAFIGLSTALCDTLLAIALPVLDPPKVTGLTSFPPVAVLLTVCDDVDVSVFSAIRRQSYPNYDVFILDDSSDNSQKRAIEESGFPVVRRGSRSGYKAGNLNNWIDSFGPTYDYFVTLDSDSSMYKDFVLDLIQYAEHPSNKDIAIFQSRVVTYNRTTLLSRLLSVVVSLRAEILSKVSNRLGTVMSLGHNNLTRTDKALEVYGFAESLGAEDTAQSLALSSKGYSVVMVDVVSFDTEPGDVFRYARRQLRWAQQTVELFRLPWRSTPLRFKVLICFYLYGNIIHNIYLALLMLVVWTPLFWQESNMTDAQLHGVLGALLTLTMAWLLQFAANIGLCRKAGVKVSSFFLFTFVAPMLMSFIAFRINYAMARTVIGDRTQFIPTNSESTHNGSVNEIFIYMMPTFIYFVVLMFGVVIADEPLLSGVTSVWAITVGAAPLSLWLLQKR